MHAATGRHVSGQSGHTLSAIPSGPAPSALATYPGWKFAGLMGRQQCSCGLRPTRWSSTPPRASFPGSAAVVIEEHFDARTELLRLTERRADGRRPGRRTAGGRHRAGRGGRRCGTRRSGRVPRRRGGEVGTADHHVPPGLLTQGSMRARSTSRWMVVFHPASCSRPGEQVLRLLGPYRREPFAARQPRPRGPPRRRASSRP